MRNQRSKILLASNENKSNLNEFTYRFAKEVKESVHHARILFKENENIIEVSTIEGDGFTMTHTKEITPESDESETKPKLKL